MTRETKIGLLVGLAFIIVIGILLSDHLTSSTEPPQAALQGVGNNVRSGVISPGQAAPAPAPVAPPVSVAPRQPVATQNELAPRPDPVQIVKVGPGTASPQPMNDTLAPLPPSQAYGQPTVVANNTNSIQPEPTPLTVNNDVNTVQPAEVVGADGPSITRAPNNPIDHVARAHGEEIVALDNTGRAVRGSLTSVRTAAEYKAEPGDTLSKMAGKLMGANTKANRDAIVAANPSLKDDPNKIIAGKTYTIPTVAGTNAAASSNPPEQSTPTPIPAGTAVKPASHETGEYWYTVKEGDSLWRIATEQCGKPSAIAAIKELNKDTLKGENHDIVVVGVKIRLPAKPLAVAN